MFRSVPDGTSREGCRGTAKQFPVIGLFQMS